MFRKSGSPSAAPCRCGAKNLTEPKCRFGVMVRGTLKVEDMDGGALEEAVASGLLLQACC